MLAIGYTVCIVAPTCLQANTNKLRTGPSGRKVDAAQFGCTRMTNQMHKVPAGSACSSSTRRLRKLDRCPTRVGPWAAALGQQMDATHDSVACRQSWPIILGQHKGPRDPHCGTSAQAWPHAGRRSKVLQQVCAGAGACMANVNNTLPVRCPAVPACSAAPLPQSGLGVVPLCHP